MSDAFWMHACLQKLINKYVCLMCALTIYIHIMCIISNAFVTVYNKMTVLLRLIITVSEYNFVDFHNVLFSLCFNWFCCFYCALDFRFLCKIFNSLKITMIMSCCNNHILHYVYWPLTAILYIVGLLSMAHLVKGSNKFNVNYDLTDY